MKYKNVCPRCGSKFEVIPSGAMCLDFYLKCRKCGYTNEPIYINKEQNTKQIINQEFEKLKNENQLLKLIQEMTKLMKQRDEPTELGMELIRNIKALKKKDIRFKDNQIYNQAIDDVLEEIK